MSPTGKVVVGLRGDRGSWPGNGSGVGRGSLHRAAGRTHRLVARRGLGGRPRRRLARDAVRGTTFAAGEVGDAFIFDGSWRLRRRSPMRAPACSAAIPSRSRFWMTSTTTGTGTYLVGKSYPDIGQGWDIRLHFGQIMVVGVNGWAVNITSAAVIEADTWYHIAVTSDGATVTLYIDGATDPAWTVARQGISGTGNPLRFGYTSGFGGRPSRASSTRSSSSTARCPPERSRCFTSRRPAARAAPASRCPRGGRLVARGGQLRRFGRSTQRDAGGRVHFDDGRVGRTFELDGNLITWHCRGRGLGFRHRQHLGQRLVRLRAPAPQPRPLRQRDNGDGFWGLRFDTDGGLEFLAATSMARRRPSSTATGPTPTARGTT